MSALLIAGWVVSGILTILLLCWLFARECGQITLGCAVIAVLVGLLGPAGLAAAIIIIGILSLQDIVLWRRK